MKCEHCKRENRTIARYCKWCGQPLATAGALDGVVGFDDIKKQLKTIVDTYTFLRSRKDVAKVRLSANTIIVGETGTGKTMLANAMRDYFYQNRIIAKDEMVTVDAVDYNRFIEKWDENIRKTKDGILFIDNVQKLLPQQYSNQVNPLDKLFVEMDKWDGNPIVLLAGLPMGLEQFLESNPAVTNRFKYRFNLPNPSPSQLTEICRMKLKERYGLTDFTAEASDRLLRFFKHQVKTKDETFGYGHLAASTAEDIFTAFISRGIDNTTIEKGDIKGYVPEERSMEQILGDLNHYIGMTEVKTAVKEIAFSVKNAMEREERGLASGEKPGVHIVLTGNPGTGKTTIARKLGEILAAIGYLDSGHVVEVDRAAMVSPYQGETPKVVNRLCDKAMGGILFVDEAYTLAPLSQAGEKDRQGEQALETLMKRMEDDRGKFVVIAAGYRMEMDNLFRINPGVKSRFNYFLNIDDYTPDELFQILSLFAKEKHYTFTPEAVEVAREAIQAMYDGRDKSFANGRSMRQLFEQIERKQAERVQSMDVNSVTNDDLTTILSDDIPYERPREANSEECMKTLDGLVGLKAVKEEIHNLVAYLNLQVRRGETSTFQGKHYVFTGNPGTGKTTVARIMADVFKNLGIISRGHLVEADRARLVAGYAGQTAIKTNQLVDSAMGGVLFIDEAYTLAQGDGDSFGAEAIDTLLKRLEDDRGKFICIVAGYTKQMHDFIDANPGLKSRFTKTIHFDDYNADELTQIFVNLAKGRNFTLDADTEAAVKRMMENACLRKDKNFGNARVARQMFDKTIERQSQRLMKGMQEGVNDDPFTLTTADLPINDNEKARPLEEVLNEMEELVGMKTVKNAVRRLAVQQMFFKQRQNMGMGQARLTTLNFVITGNPGTGKTTVARMMGEVLHSMGILPTSRVTEASRATLVGKYMGETPKIVNKVIDNALGGVLFIDEAYTLSEGDDQYGREAIDTLMKRMEDDRGKLAVIVAGYKDRMDQFLAANDGLASRFTHHLHIDDYDEEELVEIFKKMAAKDEYHLTGEAEMKLSGVVAMRRMMRGSANFGNAREMRNMLDQTVQNLSVRVSRLPAEQLTKEAFQTITPDDVPDMEMQENR